MARLGWLQAGNHKKATPEPTSTDAATTKAAATTSQVPQVEVRGIVEIGDLEDQILDVIHPDELSRSSTQPFLWPDFKNAMIELPGVVLPIR